MGVSLWTDILPAAGEWGLDILVKASLVLLAAGLTTALLRSRSAAARYAVWSAALGILIALPFLSTTLPAWQLHETDRGPSAPPPSRDLRSVEVVESAEAAPPQAADWWADRTRDPVASPSMNGSYFAAVLAAVWLAGILFMLLRLGLHLLRVNRVTACGRSPDRSGLSRIARRCAESLGIRRPVRVILCEEVTMPFSWGVRRPSVILPSSATTWPEERIQSVLLHELAHIARWDYPVHLLVEIARALYWPNPLVWIAARRNAMERERACDDCALRCGTPSDAYATHLLEIARIQVERFSMATTSMAGEPGLVERMRSVLNGQLDRSPLRRRWILMGASLMLAAVIPLAAVDLLGTERHWVIPTTGQLTSDLRTRDDPAARRRAAWWLGEHETRSAVPVLVNALRDPSADVRLAAGWALGEIKDPGSIDALSWTLENDDDALVREMAALALGEINDAKAVEPLSAAFGREEDLRGAIVWALGEIRDDQAAMAREAAFAEWQRTPWPNQEVWTGGLDEGSEFSEDTPELLERMRTGDLEERRRAAWNLGFLGILDGLDTVTPVVEGLLDALRDPAPEVRAAAIWALDEVNPSRSVRARSGRVDVHRLHEIRLNRLGYYFFRVGETERAIEVFEANLRLHPKSLNCYGSLCEVHVYQGDFERALECLEKAQALYPKDERISQAIEQVRQRLEEGA